MGAVTSRVQAELYASPQWASANAELEKATADLALAKDRIEQALATRPDYQALVEDKKAAEERAAALHERGASIKVVLPVAQRDLEVSTKLTRIRAAALANDPELIQVRDRLQAAVAARETLQRSLRVQIMNDPEWLKARKQLER
jgi:hypothetical protein